jgi:hypothetical protein
MWSNRWSTGSRSSARTRRRHHRPNLDRASSRSYDGAAAVGATTTLPDAGIAWSKTRGAVLINGTLCYGWSDGTFHKRTFDGTRFGPNTVLDPYDDPFWSAIATGSGPTGQTYRGVVPDMFGSVSNAGNLNVVGFANGQPTGAPAVADSSHDWRGRALFLR